MGRRQPEILRSPTADADTASAVGASEQTPLVRLQAAGNGAIAQLTQTLAQERDDSFAAYQHLAAEIESLGPATTLTDDQKLYHAELSKQLGVVEKRILAAINDLQLLYQPSSDQALNEMLARRQFGGSSVGDPLTTSGWISDAGLGPSRTTTQSSLVDGTATTTSNTSSTRFVATGSGVGLTSTSGTSTQVVNGASSSSQSSETSNQYGIFGGNIGYSSTSKTSSTEADPAKGYTGRSNSSTTRTVGTGGITTSTTNREQVDDTFYGTTSTSGWTRGDGQLGTTSSTSTTHGTANARGEMTSGSTITTSTGKGIVAGSDGYGGYGTAGVNASTTSAKGVKLGVSAAVDGKCTVNVTQVSVAPPKYAIALTISLGAKGGASAGAGASPGATTTGSIGANASGTVTATFSHVMNESDAAAYLAVLDKPGQAISSGAFREFTILKTALVEGDDAAAAALRGLQAGLVGDPDAASGMRDGDSATIRAEGKLGGSASAGSKGFGLSAGAGVSASYTWSVAKKGELVVLTGTPASGSSWTAGGTLAYGAATGGYSYGSSSASSNTFTFTLDPRAAGYQTLYHQIIVASSKEELARIVAEHPEIAGTRKATETEGATETFQAGLGPLSLGITSGSSRSSSATTDSEGKVTGVTEAGSSSGGAALSLGGLEVASYSETGAVTTTVGSNKKASGDASIATSEANFSETLDQFIESPIASIIGLFTGSTKLAKDTDVKGMQLSDADYDAIAAAAYSDLGTWQKPLSSPFDLKDWNTCRARIRGSGGDRAVMAKALADFAAGGRSDRSAIVQGIVRPRGKGTGGTLYEWPDELNAQKAMFTALVDGDPVKGLRDMHSGGQTEQARKSATDLLAMLSQLTAEMQQRREHFTSGAAFGEMLRRIADRRAEITREAKLLEYRASQPAVSKVPTADEAMAEELATLAADREAARVRLDALNQSLQAFLATQTRIFGIVQAEQAKDKIWYKKPDIYVIIAQLNELRDKVYPAWDVAYREALAAAKEAGLPDPPESSTPKPARDWWKRLHDISIKW